MAKFCMKCGKPLIDGQVCECLKPSAPLKDEPWRRPAPTTDSAPRTVSAPVSPAPTTPPFKTAPETTTPPYTTTATSSTHEKDSPAKTKTSSLVDTVDKAADAIKKTVDKIDTNKLLNLWKNFLVKIGVEEPENDINVYERGKKIVPECISANEGEIPVKQYVVAKLRTPLKLARAEGRLQITNKRVIFRAPGRALLGKTVLQHEFELSEIAGIEARKEQKFSFLSWLFAVGCAAKVGEYAASFLGFVYKHAKFLGDPLCFIILICGILPSFLMHKKFLFKAAIFGSSVASVKMLAEASKTFHGLATKMVEPIAVLWVICSLLYSIKTNLVLSIKTKGASGAVEIRRKKPFSILGFLLHQPSEKEDYTGFSQVLPMKDTEKAIREAGAVISDIQKFGDYGIEKWKED